MNALRRSERFASSSSEIYRYDEDDAKLLFHGLGEADFLSSLRARISLPLSRVILEEIRQSTYLLLGNLRAAV